MINKVIICGIRRANEYVPQLEINQMIGRGGRSYEVAGEAIVFVPQRDELMATKYLFGGLPDVESVMDGLDNIAFHVLPQIFSRAVYNKETFFCWYNRSLASFQGKNVSYEEIISFLFDCDAIEIKDEVLYITEFGKISCKMYLHPMRVKKIKDRFIVVCENKKLSDPYALSWVFAYQKLLVKDVNEGLVDDYKSTLSYCGYYLEKEEFYHGLTLKCVFNNERPGALQMHIKRERNDILRILSSLKLIATALGIIIGNEIEDLIVAVKSRTSLLMAKLMNDIGVKDKRYAAMLVDFGVTSVEKLIMKYNSIIERGDADLVKYLTECDSEALRNARKSF